jgi:hypothetical protein
MIIILLHVWGVQGLFLDVVTGGVTLNSAF